MPTIMLDALLDRWTPVRLLVAPGARGRAAETLACELAAWRLKVARATADGQLERLRRALLADAHGLVPELGACEIEALDRSSALAFWINVYNALVAHAQLSFPRARSPWLHRQYAWFVAGELYTADAVEHGVLRENRGHPRLRGPSFFRGDSRRRRVLRPLDPRVHAALHCGRTSCPPVQIYRGATLDRDLESAFASLVMNSAQRRDETTYVIHPVLYDHRRDFGGSAALLERVRAHVEVPEGVRLRRA